jgi:hypothetical protein
MSLSKKLFGVALITALGTSLLSAQLSSATHVRPKGASPLHVPIVIAYKAVYDAEQQSQRRRAGAVLCAADAGVELPAGRYPGRERRRGELGWDRQDHRDEHA